MNKRFSKFMLTSASALALLAAYPSVASTAEVVGFDLPAITAEAATQGNAFIRVVRALPSVANITSADAASVRAARNLYNSLPNAEKANADVTRWAGYLADKEAALPVDHVRNFLLESRVLPNVAEINAMNATEFAQAKVDLQAARASYAQLTDAEKANADVARWAGYLTVKEDAFGVTFILAAKDLPSMDAIGEMDAEELVAVQEDIDSVRELYDALSDVAKADSEVARWIGYVDQKEEAAEEAAVVELAIDSTRAINAKTIEVTFNKAVEDTAATVELVRGSFKQNVTVNWASDRESVQLVGANNFQPATYNVAVNGQDIALTSSVTIEAQKVASIEILDDIAVVSKSVNAEGKLPAGATATVAYVVRDQYGTDITSSTTLTSSDTTNISIKPQDGVIELSGSLVVGKEVGDIVPIVLVDRATGVSTTKSLTLSSASAVSSMNVAGIYNAKGEQVSLNDQSKATEAYIVLDLKDQYGNKITDVELAKGLLVTNTNNTVLTLKDDVRVQQIGKDDQLVLDFNSILKAGNANIILISRTTGRSTTYTIEVAETATTDGIAVSQPEIAVAGEDMLIPLTVTDKEGNIITDKKLLTDTTKGIKVDTNRVSESDLEIKDGQVYYKTQFSAEGPQALVFQSSTFKVATLTLNVRATATPTVVRGLQNPLVLSVPKGDLEITAKDHLIIEDQYGRVMEGYSTNNIQVSLVDTTSTVVSVEGNVVTPKENGTARLNISLTNEAGEVITTSTVQVQVRVTDGREYDSYEIAPLGLIQASDVDGAGAQNFTVNGILNGGKVALEPAEYTATLSGGRPGKTVEDGLITVPKAALNVNDNGSSIDTEFTLRVTVNATGDVLEHKFTVSPAKQKVQDFFFTKDEEYKDAKAVTETTVTTVTTPVTAADLGVNVATVDQYGNKVVVPVSASNVTIVPADASKVTIKENGKNNASVELRNDDVEEATVTFNVTIGNATKAITVKLTR